MPIEYTDADVAAKGIFEVGVRNIEREFNDVLVDRARLRALLAACKRAMQASEERPDIHTYWGNMIAAIDAALGGEEGK